ncbi:MAG TPA: hypothetical protein PLB21_02980 [Actinomycetota bacterium]|nr:hypothetical protein [Actinomycetota bacterium]
MAADGDGFTGIDVRDQLRSSTKDAFGESSIGAIFVVLAIAGIQLQLPDTVTVGPFWLIPAIEVLGAPGLLMVLKAAGTPGRALRTGLYAYLIFLVAASVLNAMLLLRSLLDDTEESGKILLFAGFGVLFINVLSFALVYWQLDGGGPKARRSKPLGRPDFLFPQQDKYPEWQPTLPDYLFTAYTNIIAFSPTDTMPLTHRVKFLFTVQSSVSLLTILVTVSRAINLIN